MSKPRSLQALNVMVGVRQREVERAADELKTKHALLQRYRNNISLLEQLSAPPSTGQTVFNSSQAMNMSAYKGQLSQIKLSQQQDLALSEADAELSRQSLLAARLKREAMAQVHAAAARHLLREQERREQKHTDEAAGQSWQRQAQRF
ncbi:flagellar export protein FliJ [Craterilacuibacter sp. RT1T]|uniref:flagellar export protein FliJ n=1 Tax=Craterilacuibacter sp. RT1T TaxID=2942211 RepID=UPI0020C16D2B|nr:flagellar export protein FliJ [Craterilacuibacter sp. RT1T]MCL6262264.1 flagellar export protein FliJ [Craterilacuibacter sp. RT1T]